MYEILKAYCSAQGYEFTYARRDFQNLHDEIEQDGIPCVFLDPVICEDVVNDSGVKEGEKASGSFMVLVSSELDEDEGTYDYRYNNHIKPIKETILPAIKKEIRCNNEVEFNVWKTTEIINILDYNFDGIIVEFNITFEL